MDGIDLLEKRIEALEEQILPKETSLENKSQAITDLLLQSQTMITSALSCRESITSILGHMTTINNYLDPCNWENDLEVEAKRHYLLELYPELRNTVQLVRSVQKLIPYTNSDKIMKVTELSGKLEQLTETNLVVYSESRDVTQKVLKSLQQYNDITTSIKVLFAQLDRAVVVLEEALLPKFETEE
ncbi:unnamed protein product [Ceutorhynchus assimilis]|uniref:Dynactin subunit 3 n=1 Tax=Ceutorhynchus assimilis TaxID=467358 RepID=A0A9N9QMN7_9CUCU|nr:unnamed protein product [Ceutorhynchus assimilis]